MELIKNYWFANHYTMLGIWSHLQALLSFVKAKSIWQNENQIHEQWSSRLDYYP